MPEERELHLEQLVAEDRTAMGVLGVFAAGALKTYGVATFVVDSLGRIVLVPPSQVSIGFVQSYTETELDGVDDDTSIRALLAQGADDNFIKKYLRGREARMRGC